MPEEVHSAAAVISEVIARFAPEGTGTDRLQDSYRRRRGSTSGTVCSCEGQKKTPRERGVGLAVRGDRRLRPRPRLLCLKPTGPNPMNIIPSATREETSVLVAASFRLSALRPTNVRSSLMVP